MSKLLLLKVKMRRIDIPVSEIGTHFQTFSVADEGLGGDAVFHFQTFSVADEGLGGDAVFLCRSTLSINALFWKKNRTHCGISPDRSIEELMSPSQ